MFDVADQTVPFQQLDFVYTPSREVAADLAYFTEVLGGRVVFAAEAMGTRVAAVELTKGPPLILLADHVDGDRTRSPARRPAPWHDAAGAEADE